jgi:transcriptional regulator with XRE-family HTH domain
MVSIADLLDRAKAGGNIDTDYRLAKVIGISHQGMTNYRTGKSRPDARVLEQLCALSGDDVAVFAAQLQAERERTDEGKTLWLMIAKRLAGGATTAILSVVFSIVLIAGYAQPTWASERFASNDQTAKNIDCMKYDLAAMDGTGHRAGSPVRGMVTSGTTGHNAAKADTGR